MKWIVSMLIGLALFTTGCVKDELPVPAHVPSGSRTLQLCMEAGYENQLWYDISSGEVVSQNPKTAWDLAFENGAAGWHVLLNGSKLMTAWNSGPHEITSPTDTTGMGSGKHYDRPSGHLDSTAIGDWPNVGQLYIIDLGYDANGASLGLKKMRLLGVDADAYSVETADLDGSGWVAHTVPKDPHRDHTLFSFANGVVPIEPLQGTWDLVLTRYTVEFIEPYYLPYLVSGFFSAQSTRVARVPDATFQNVSLSDTTAHPFLGRRDAIGYDWKTYSFESSSYIVDPSLVFIIEDAEGLFYKLRFLDYYNQVGETGCPSFELVVF